mgnify:CR=1 FL=1
MLGCTIYVTVIGLMRWEFHVVLDFGMQIRACKRFIISKFGATHRGQDVLNSVKSFGYVAWMHVWMMGCLLYVCNIKPFVSCADACMDGGLLVVRL